jgi:hypothetical protein
MRPLPHIQEFKNSRLTQPASVVNIESVARVMELASVTRKIKSSTHVMPMKSLYPPPARLLLAVLASLALSPMPLRAEDVYVTSWLADQINGCPPSCSYNLGTSMHATCFSTACHVGRNGSLFAVTTNAGWAVTPRLANNPGVYRIFVTKGPAGDCSADIMVNITTTGGALADAGGTAQTTVPTTAFQKDQSTNTWTLVGYLTNNTTQPTVIFAYASGGYNRFYMDAVDFQSVDVISNPAGFTVITQILYGNPVILSGTGPVSHPFALVSSTSAANALNQWTPEETNTAGTGFFTFSVAPGTAHSRFFRIVTQ